MKNLKRVLSLMMAVLLCFGLFPGSALAAENDYDGYLAMIEYKDRRYSLSENLPAPFGGRTTEEFFELRINDLRTYRTAYCIQMGVRANSGIGYESSDDYASFTEEQKALINTTLTLGYNMETGTKYGGSAIDEYIATQILIWLIAHNQLGTGYESQIVNEITANSPAAKTIFYTLRENVMNYRTIPSFTTDDHSAVGAYTHALQYNESTGKNETTLVDENDVLGDFTFSCPGVDFSVDGNQLHVSTSETDFGTITAEKSLPSSIPGVVTGGTKYWLRDTYQNVVTFDVEGEAQPVKTKPDFPFPESLMRLVYLDISKFFAFITKFSISFYLRCPVILSKRCSFPSSNVRNPISPIRRRHSLPQTMAKLPYSRVFPKTKAFQYSIKPSTTAERMPGAPRGSPR